MDNYSILWPNHLSLAYQEVLPLPTKRKDPSDVELPETGVGRVSNDVVWPPRITDYKLSSHEGRKLSLKLGIIILVLWLIFGPKDLLLISMYVASLIIHYFYMKNKQSKSIRKMEFEKWMQDIEKDSNGF